MTSAPLVSAARFGMHFPTVPCAAVDDLQKLQAGPVCFGFALA